MDEDIRDKISLYLYWKESLEFKNPKVSVETEFKLQFDEDSSFVRNTLDLGRTNRSVN